MLIFSGVLKTTYTKYIIQLEIHLIKIQDYSRVCCALYSKPFQELGDFPTKVQSHTVMQLYICSDCNIMTPITTEGSGITVSSCKTLHVYSVSPYNRLNSVKL